MLELMDLDTSIRVRTLSSLIIILNMFLVTVMTILVHKPTGIQNNKTIGLMLIPYKAKSMAIILDMTI